MNKGLLIGAGVVVALVIGLPLGAVVIQNLNQKLDTESLTGTVWEFEVNEAMFNGLIEAELQPGGTVRMTPEPGFADLLETMTGQRAIEGNWRVDEENDRLLLSFEIDASQFAGSANLPIGNLKIPKERMKISRTIEVEIRGQELFYEEREVTRLQ